MPINLKHLDPLDAYEVGYREGSSDVSADWHIAWNEENPNHKRPTYAEAADIIRRYRKIYKVLKKKRVAAEKGGWALEALPEFLLDICEEKS